MVTLTMFSYSTGFWQPVTPYIKTREIRRKPYLRKDKSSSLETMSIRQVDIEEKKEWEREIELERLEEMSKILGYGEDALTLWALKQHISDILEKFQDQTTPSDCLIFYRPSFGRSGGEKSAQFGEFDAVLVSSENIYLIESKWDNLSRFKNDQITIRDEQELRHRIFSWYITHWDKKYSDNWESFMKEQMDDFQKKFTEKRIAPTNSILARNLEFILSNLQKCCKNFSSEHSIKNVLLFFHNRKFTTPPSKISGNFNLLSIDYSQEIMGNFISLD